MTNNVERAVKVSAISIAGNVILSLLKLIAGVVAQSSAMVSDAVHSASDVASSIVVIIGVKISSKAADNDHQYGHERLECVAAFVLATILCITGAGIGYKNILNAIASVNGEGAFPGMPALVAAVISIVTKEAMYQYTKAAAKSIKSDALMADAWHHRSDALSSVGSFVGILGARLGLKILDPAAALVISIMVIKAAYDIAKNAMDKMVDKACDDETVETMTNVIKGIEGVLSLDLIKTRIFASKIYVDVEIGTDGDQTLRSAHNIAENVHHAIETNFPDVKHCTVHVNPK